MRIGIDIRNIGKKRTGDEAVFFNLVKNLAEIDSANEYLLFTDITDVTILRNIKKELGIENKSNFKIISLFMSFPRKRESRFRIKSGMTFLRRLFNNKFIWNAWTLPRYLRKNPVDVYHTQYILPFFVSRKIKLITTVHDISFNFYPKFIKWTDLFFLKILIPWSLKRADKIIAVSEFTKSEIIKFYKVNPEKIETIYNATGDNFLKDTYTASELNLVREKYNLPEKFILYIGTMQPRKNIPFLIEAYANVKNKLDGTKLVIAGKKSHNYDKKIDEVMAKHNLKDEVLFPDYIDESDKPILFNLSHFFIFPSLYEGFGIPVLEAMSQSVPVLASDIPSLKEVGGETVLYFNPRDLASLEKALYNISINQNLREKLARSGLERSRFFSWEKTARKILEVYKNLTGNRS